MAEVKAYVRANNTATIICPSCHCCRHLQAEKYRHRKHTLKARCRCGAVFLLRLDFRRFYRKTTSLPGTYASLSAEKPGGGVIHIRNISRGGIGFTVSGIHNLEPGLPLTLDFTLNDKKMTRLRKQALVRTVNGNYIGCQFPENDPVEKALGFYLQN